MLSLSSSTLASGRSGSGPRERRVQSDQPPADPTMQGHQAAMTGSTEGTGKGLFCWCLQESQESRTESKWNSEYPGLLKVQCNSGNKDASIFN